MRLRITYNRWGSGERSFVTHDKPKIWLHNDDEGDYFLGYYDKCDCTYSCENCYDEECECMVECEHSDDDDHDCNEHCECEIPLNGDCDESHMVTQEDMYKMTDDNIGGLAWLNPETIIRVETIMGEVSRSVSDEDLAIR